MDCLEFRRKNPNLEMLTPKAPGPTLQLPLLHGIFSGSCRDWVPLTASAAASRNTNPYARCYYRSVISGGSPYGGSDQLLDFQYCTSWTHVEPQFRWCQTTIKLDSKPIYQIQALEHTNKVMTPAFSQSAVFRSYGTKR